MTEKELVEKLRKKYAANPPEGMTRQDILQMSDLLKLNRLFRMPASRRAFPFKSAPLGAVSY